jgi:hypothetical protein
MIDLKTALLYFRPEHRHELSDRLMRFSDDRTAETKEECGILPDMALWDLSSMRI